MVRPRRIELNEGIYHVYNRFIDGHRFFNTPNYKAFLDIFTRNAKHFNIDVLLVTCMPNHFHSIIRIHESNLSAFLQKYGTGFARYINFIEDRKGHVFQNRHQSKLITSDEYFLNCLSYVIYNPVDAGLVDRPERYELTTLKSIIVANNNIKYDIIYNIFHQERHTGRKLFRKWIHSPDIKKRYNDLFTDSNRQVNGDNIENAYVFSSIERREEEIDIQKKKRAKDFSGKVISIEQVLDIVSTHRKRHKIKGLWKSDRSFLRHLKWYLFRYFSKLELKEIARMDRIKRHTTISEAIRSIEKNRKKRQIVFRIIKSEHLE